MLLENKDALIGDSHQVYAELFCEVNYIEGKILFSINNYERAIEKYREVTDFSMEGANVDIIRANALANMGSTRCMSANFEAALGHTKEGEDLLIKCKTEPEKLHLVRYRIKKCATLKKGNHFKESRALLEQLHTEVVHAVKK